MLENWLSKVNNDIITQIPELSPETIGRSIKIHKDLFPSLDDCQIVLIGDNSQHMDFIRAQFYEMYHHFDNLSIADLGDIRKNDTNFLISLFTELLESKLIPVIVSNNQELIHTFHFALNAFHNNFNSLHCGKKYANFSPDDYANCQKVTNMGIQGHYNSLESLRTENTVRLADIKNNIEEAEPYTRNADTIVFNLNSICHSSIPGCKDSSPSGLNADETTQLFRFFGFSDQLKALIINGYDAEFDFNHQTAQLIAQGLWYFIEAMNHCKLENINSTEDFHEFVVDIEGLDIPISFIKAKKTGRWWIKSIEGENHLIPCSHRDYLSACKNEIPDRLLNA